MTDQGQGLTASPAPEAIVGAGEYVVEEGECVSSIAYEHGHLWETILNDPANQELKQNRKNHNILLPGDRLTIPPVREKNVSAETDKLHRFQLKGVKEIFQVRLLDLCDQPRANLPYVLFIGRMRFSGKTNGQGELKHFIPPNARKGRLILGKGKDREEIDLRLGELDPTSAISGAQARLANLGLDCGPIDGILGPKTREVLKRFQKANQLAQSGELDDATKEKLEAKHGC